MTRVGSSRRDIMKIPNREAYAKIGTKVLYEVRRTMESDTVRVYRYFYTDLASATGKYDDLCRKYPWPKSRYITLNRWDASGLKIVEVYCNRLAGISGEYRDVSRKR